jgi:uncharacterized phosphosugar-binding protein
MLSKQYFKKGLAMLERLEETQSQPIQQAAEMIAQATAEGHTFFAWGGPHSSLPVQDIFWRAGGLAIVNAVFTPGLSLEVGPLRPTSTLERVEGFGEEFFKLIGAEAGDVILLVSTSGRNAFPVEMAMSAKEAGLKVIGVTSLAYSQSVTSRHSSGMKMYEYCDIVIDNLSVPGDAILEDDRLPQKVGPTSGWVGCFLLQALMVEVAERLAEKGIQPPVYYALNMDGKDEYVSYMERLVEERSTRFGGIYSPLRKQERAASSPD